MHLIVGIRIQNSTSNMNGLTCVQLMHQVEEEELIHVLLEDNDYILNHNVIAQRIIDSVSPIDISSFRSVTDSLSFARKPIFLLTLRCLNMV
jgi:hypothetical protein